MEWVYVAGKACKVPSNRFLDSITRFSRHIVTTVKRDWAKLGLVSPKENAFDRSAKPVQKDFISHSCSHFKGGRISPSKCFSPESDFLRNSVFFIATLQNYMLWQTLYQISRAILAVKISQKSKRFALLPS